MALVARTRQVEPGQLEEVGGRGTTTVAARWMGDERRGGAPLFDDDRPNDFRP